MPREKLAPRVLIALSTSLALGVIDEPDQELLLSAMAEVLPLCDGCSRQVESVRLSVDRLLRARTTKERDLQEIDLRRALRRYHNLAGFYHLESLRAGLT